MERIRYGGLIYNVSLEEYGHIKGALEGFMNDITEGSDFRFIVRYNRVREAIGIWLGEKPILNDLDLPEEDGSRDFFVRIKNRLERELDSLRIPHEEWLDSLMPESEED